MKIKDRVKRFARVPASELIPNPKNWRTHPTAQADALRGVLADIGFADAALVRETEDGLQLIDGHLRAEVASDAEIPVLILDVTEAEADRILATHDPLSVIMVASIRAATGFTPVSPQPRIPTVTKTERSGTRGWSARGDGTRYSESDVKC